MIKKYVMYLLRWQLSTPLLSVILYLMRDRPTLLSTVVANLIGGLIFFWVDRYIFNPKEQINKLK